MTADFTQIDHFAKLSAKKCARQFSLDYEICLSEAYYAVATKIPKFDDNLSSLSTYIYRVVTHQVINYLRTEYTTKKRKCVSSMGDKFDFGKSEVEVSTDAQEVIKRACELAGAGYKTKTIKSRIEKSLLDDGWKKNRIADAFDSVENALDSKSFITN